nr:uncharacterized protein LOC111427558 [Onthophagus taurus]
MGNPAQRSSHREFWQCRHNELRNAQLLEIHPNMKQRLEGMETTFQTYPLVQNQNWPSRSKRCGCPTPATEEANTQSGNTNPCTCDTCVLSNVPCDIPCQCNKQVKVQQPTQNSDNSAQIGDPKVVKNNDNVQGSVKRCGCPKPNDEISKQNKNTIDENSVQIGTLDYNSTPGNDGNLNSCTCQTCTLGDVAVDIPCKCIKVPGGSQPNGTPSIKNAVNVQNGNINPCSCQTCPLGDVPYNIPCQCIKTAQASSPIQRNGNFGQNAQPTKNGANLQTSVKKCGCPFPINNEVNAQNGNINPCSCQTCPLGDVPYNIPCQCNKTAQAGPPIQRNGNFGQNAATINNSQPTKNEANLQRSVKNCGCPFPINNVVNAQNGNINPCSCQTCPLGDVSYNIPCQCTKSQNVPQPFTKKETDYTPKPVKDNINARGALKKCGCSYSSENVQINMQKGTNPNGCLCKTCPLADGSYGIPCQCNKSTGKAPSQKNYNSSQNKTIPSKPPISDACKCDPCPLADSRYQTPCQCNESTQPTKTSNSNNCKCKTCPLDPSTCPCNTLQKDNESCSCEESDSSSLPDNISVGQDDAEYVEKLRKMLENEKTLGKELDDLGRTKKCYEGRVKETQGLTGTSGSGDYEILNLKRLNEKLEENNNNLEAEIEETIANIKHLKENVEEPMKREIEAEKKKIRDLEEIFRRQQGGAECKRMAEEKEFEFFQSQLQHANQYLADLNMVNKRLKEELCMLNCRCSELQTDIINQKLSEIHTISRLYAQKRRDKKSIPKKPSKGSSDGGDEDGWDGGGGGPQPRHKGSRRSSSLSSSLSISCKDLSDIKVCPQDRPCPGKDGQPKGGTSQNELDVIAQNLEALLTQAAECQCTDSDLVDTVKYIKDLVDMLNVPDTVHVPSSESLPYCECAEDGICIDVTDDTVPTKDVEPPVVISEEDEILGQEILSVLLDYLDAQIDDTQIGAKVKCICPTPDEVSVPIPPEESIPTEAQGEEEKPVSDVIDRIEGDGDALGEGDEAQENVEAVPLDTTDAKVAPLDAIDAEVAPLDTIDAEVAPLDTANAEGEEATQPEEICNDVEEVPEVVERRRVCYGPPCLKKLPPLKDVLAIGPDGRPINVLMGDDGKPKLDETGHLLDMNGHRIPSNYVLTAALPVIGEQPIEEKVIEDAGLLEGGEADVVLDEQEKPLLEEEVAPEELQLDQEGVPVVDEKGDINLDEQAGEILDVPESEMDETGKPILDVALDEQAEVLGEIGEPTVDVMLVDQEKPLLDDSGRLFDETGALITCKSFGKPPCAIDVDDTILEETPVRPPCEIVDEDVELVPLPEAETTADILPSPDAESVKIISRSTEGDYVTTATASGSELHITTEGPIGLIDTTVKLTDSGNVQVHTDMTEFEEEKIIDEESLAPTDVTSEPTEESAHTEIDEGAIGDVARSEETEEETTEVESEATEEGADEESTPESIPPICEMEEPEEVSEIESVVKKPCVCKSDKACQCTATDQECQCEEEKEEEKVDDQEVDLGADEHICKPDICASGERGGDGPWKCECGKAKSTLCSECANKDDDDKGSRIQLDVTIRCDPPCCVIKSTTRYNDSDSSKSDSNNSVDNLSAIKSKSGSVKGVPADNCGDVGIQQNYYDLEDDDKAICTIPTCPVLIAKNKDVDTLVESKVKLGMTEHSSDTNGRQSRGPCCSCSKQTSTVETPQGNAQETPQETSQGEARKTSSKSCSCRLKGSRTTSGNVFSDRNAVSNYTQSTCDASTCPVRIQVSRDIEQGVPGDRDKQCTCGAPCCQSTVNAAISPINVRGTGSVCCRRSRRTTPLSGDSGQRSLVSSNTRNPCCCDSTAFGGTQRISSGRGSLKFDLSTGPSGRCICNGSQPFSEQSSKYEGGFSPMLECTCSDGSTAYDTPPQQCSNCKCTCDGDSQPFSQFTGCACSEQSTAIKTVDLDLKLPASESILEDPSCTSSTCEERDKTLDKPHGSNDCLKTCACIQESVSTMRSFDTEETPMCKPSFECLPICAKAICGKTTVDASVMTPSKSESIGDSQDVEGTCTPKTCKKGRAASRRSCSLPTCKKRRRLSSKGTIEEGDEETKKPPPGVMLDENGQPILDAEGHMLTPSGHVLPDGVQIDAEGHLLTPSGHIIPPGVQLDESGHPLLDAEGHMLTASGHVLPEGVQIDAEGHLLTPSGHIIPPGVQLDESGHPLLDAEGHMLTASGHVLPEGVQIDAEGHLLTPSGHIIPPGVQLDESGHPLLDAEGHMLTASGHVLPEGVQIDAEGHIVTPSGHILPPGVQLDESGHPMLDAEGHMLTASGHVLPDGVQIDAEGHIVSPSGHVLPPGVQLDESGHPMLDAEGHMLTASGHVLPDGVQIDAEGHIVTPSGHVLPDGVQMDAEGHMVTASGHVLPPGVQLDASGKPLVDAEGHMLTTSGHVLPDGVQMDAEGHMVTASGHVLPPGVQLDATGKPLVDAEGHILTTSGHVLPAGVQMDAEGHMVTASGHVLPPGVQLDASGKPLVDAEGHMLTTSGHVLPDGVQMDAEGHMVTASGHVLPPGVQLDASGKPLVDAEGHMLTTSGHVLPEGVQMDAEGHMVSASGHVIPPGVQLDASGQPILDAEGHMLTADGTPVMGEDLAKMGALGPDGTPTGAPIGCKCKKCNIAICECKEPVCETDQHPPNCTCIDCICDPSKFDRSTVGDAAHPPDCVCVDCLCDPSNGFLKTSVEVEGPKDAHKVPCDCQVCLCTPCADETKNFVCPTSLPPHHPDCTCAECLCEECIHVPDCDCPECICARCARFNVPTNPCTCPECVCAPCGDTEKFPEAERQDAGDKLFEQYLVEGDAPIPGMKKIGELCGCEPMDQDDASKSGASKQLDANENSLPPLGPGKTRHPDCKCTPDCDCEKCLDIPPCECEDFLCENCADENMNRKKREFEAQHSPECDCPQCKCNPCRDKNMDLTCVCDENFTCENCLGKKAGVTCDCDENFTCDNCLYKKKKEGDAGGEGAEVEKGKEKDEVVSQHPVDCNCSSCKCNPCVDDVIEAQKKERAKACDTGAEKNDLCDCWFCMCKSCKDPKIRAITNAPISSIFKNWDQVDIPDLSPLKDAFKKTSQQPNGCQCHDCACDPCKLDPFRSSLNTGHGGKCTCTSCTCSGSKNKAEKKEHGKECNCDKCVCDPCDDPIFRTKRTLEKLKKDMPEPHSADCDCPICRCAPCMDPKHGPGCKCPECVCEPCPKQPQPTDKHGQSCKCPICSPVSAPHGPLCDCPQCLCKPCADVNIASSQSMEDKHGPSCQCPICGPLAVNHGKGCKCPVCAPKDKSKQSKHKSKSKSSRPCKCVGACSCGPSKKKQRSKSTDDDLRKKKKSKDNVAGCKCKHCQKSAKQENASPDNADRKKEIEELEALMEQIRCSCDSAEVDAACHYSGSAPAPPPCPLKILDLQNSLKSLQQKCETKDKIIQEMQGKLQGKPDSGSVNAIPNNTPLPPPGPCGKCAPTAAIVSIKEVTRISSESVLVKWTQPCNNLVIGYEVSVNDVLRSRVHSAQRNSAVVFGVRSAKKATILVHAITHYGRCEPPASYDFES